MAVDFVKIGQNILNTYGEKAVYRVYETTDPEWVGRTAVAYGDADLEGTLN